MRRRRRCGSLLPFRLTLLYSRPYARQRRLKAVPAEHSATVSARCHVTVKVLVAPHRGRGSFIAAVDGELRVIVPPRCHGYANCCVCPECKERAELVTMIKSRAPKAPLQPWEVEAA